MRRDYRRKWLTTLGWQVLQDNVVFAPGEDPDDWTEMHSLATAARAAGLPDEVSELMLWRPPPPPGWRPRPTRQPDFESIEDDASDAVGETWTEPVTAPNSAELRTLEWDPAVSERGLRGHVETEAGLANCLRRLGLEPRRPSAKAGDPPFDVAWICSGILFVAEVKSTTRDNEEHQLRLGLGQLLRYRWQLGRQAPFPVKGILVPENDPSDPEWSALCESLGITLLPGPPLPNRLPSLVRF